MGGCNPPRERKVGGVCNPSVEVLEKLANIGLLAAETGQQRQIQLEDSLLMRPSYAFFPNHTRDCFDTPHCGQHLSPITGP